VHRADCKSFAKSSRDAARVVEASWEGEGLVETHFHVTIGQRPNVLSDLTNALRPINIDLLRADYRADEAGLGTFNFTVETSGKSAVGRIVRALNTVNGVQEITTTSESGDANPKIALAG